MSLRSGAATLLLALGSAVTGLRAQQPLDDVRVVATDDIQDVAVTRREFGQPVIYFNPTLVERVGPLLGEFFIAHEFGHVYYNHVGGALAEQDSTVQELRQRQELEADCYAAAKLAVSNRAAVEAAIQFFTRMGPFTHDQFHPSGSRRAANLLACLPPPAVDSSNMAPTGSNAATDATTIQLGPDAAAHLHGLVRVRIDGRLVGTISTLSPTTPIVVKRLHDGPHRYDLTIELYSLDNLLQVTPAGVIRNDGVVEFERGGHLEINWLDAEPPALLPVQGAPRKAVP